jgi:hypothetical protein
VDVETTRFRFGSILEWALAAALIAAVVAGGSTLFQELRTVRAIVPVIAGEAFTYSEPPAGIPSRAVSVPMLLLGNGREVQLGDRVSEVTDRLGSAVKVLSESLERDAVRERLTRFYSDVGLQFVVVFEAIERNAEPRVAAIYMR